ncbi:hypothetical protein ACSQ67_019970 [Phaseolus vulgaris]
MMADLNMLLELLLDGADLALVQPRWQLEFEALKYRRGLVQFEWCRMLLCRGNGIFCKCWSYAGPNARNLTATAIEDICIVQSEGELDPVLVSFLEMTQGKLDLFSSRSVSASKGVSSMKMEKRDAKPSIAKVFSPEGLFL